MTKELKRFIQALKYNGRARYVYLQSALDIVNEKFEEVKK